MLVENRTSLDSEEFSIAHSEGECLETVGSGTRVLG